MKILMETQRFVAFIKENVIVSIQTFNLILRRGSHICQACSAVILGKENGG